MSGITSIGKIGRGYVFECVIGQTLRRFIVSDEMLDDEVGSARTEEESKNWIEQHADDLCKAASKKMNGGFGKAPFNRIVPEGV